MGKNDGALKQKAFYISRLDWKKLIDYAKAADLKYNAEISGMMIMRPQDDGTYLMSDPTILPQTISGARTEIKKEALASYYMERHLESKKHPDLGEELRFVWWHSHCKMKAFMSTTDEDTMLEGKDDDWTASLVVNVMAEYELRINWFIPAHVYSKIVLYILEDRDSDELSEDLIKEVDEIVERPVTQFPLVGGQRSEGTESLEDYYTRRDIASKQKQLPPHKINHYTKPVSQEDTGWNPETANEGELVCDFLTSCTSFMDGLIKAYRKGKMPYKELLTEFRDLSVFSEIFGIYILMPEREELFKEKVLTFDPNKDRSIASMFYYDELSDYSDAGDAQSSFRGI